MYGDDLVLMAKSEVAAKPEQTFYVLSPVE